MAIYMWREQGWQPTANTIAYFPFQDDIDDAVVGGPTVTTVSGLNLTTLNGVKCLQITNGNAYIDTQFKVSDVTSIMVWFYGDYSDNMLRQGSTYGGGGNDRGLFINNSHQLIYYRYNASHLYGPTLSGTDLSKWHCWGVTEDGNGAKMFLDGASSAVASVSGVYNGPKLIYNTGLGCYYLNNSYNSETGTGYIAQLVLLNSTITVTDFLDFYNQTKGLYGIN